jgi:hypothetical protein
MLTVNYARQKIYNFITNQDSLWACHLLNAELEKRIVGVAYRRSCEVDVIVYPATSKEHHLAKFGRGCISEDSGL